MSEGIKKSFWDYLKIASGSVLIALVSSFLTHQYNMASLEQKKLEHEMAFMQDFIDVALDDNLERRHRFAHYFSRLLGGKWDLYYADLRLEMLTKKAELDRLRTKKDADPDVKVRYEVLQQDVLPDPSPTPGLRIPRRRMK